MSNQFMSSNYLVVDSNFLVVVYLTDFSYRQTATIIA